MAGIAVCCGDRIIQGNRIKKTRKINDLGITRVLAYVYI